MRPLTFSFTVQVSGDGRLLVHRWHATYDSKGRQLPTSDTTAHDVTNVHLEELAREFVRDVLAARQDYAASTLP